MSMQHKNGPAPTPTALNRLRGNPGKRALNADEPVLPAAPDTFDEPPLALADDPVAIEAWRDLAPVLRRARIVTDADARTLAAACQQWSLYLGALAQAPADRRVVMSHNKFPIINPYINIANKALTQCIRLWEGLGLTPASRARITAAPAPSDGDPFAEFDALLPPRAREGPTLRTKRRDADDDDDFAH